jgi:hypothetical protein
MHWLVILTFMRIPPSCLECGCLVKAVRWQLLDSHRLILEINSLSYFSDSALERQGFSNAVGKHISGWQKTYGV